MTLDRHHLAAARLWAADRFPYLATALFAATVVEREGLGGDGVAVDDRWRLYIDPDRANAWSVSELGALLIHHTGHLVRDHAGRAETLGITSSTATSWSTVADAELNDDLVDAGLTMPGSAILPDDLGFERGRMAEEYFHLLRGETGRGEGQTSDHGSGAHGQPRQWEESAGDEDVPPGLTDHESDLLRASSARQMLEAVRTGRGNVPSRWQRWAEELLTPAVDWRRTLAAEIRRGVQSVSGAVDYTYRRPSRRASAVPTVVLPALEKPVPHVAVVCDTSASMGQRELGRVLAEVEGLLSGIGLRSGGIRVLAVDTDVHVARRISSSRQVELIGGGGTDMAKGIEAAVATRPRPAVIVVLTDGETPWPETAPQGVRVIIGLLVASSKGRRVPPISLPTWARVIPIDCDEIGG